MSLAIMQFPFSWNDLLIPLLFPGGSDLAAPITVQAAGLVQTKGKAKELSSPPPSSPWSSPSSS